MLILKCVYLGEMLGPQLGAGLSMSCLSLEASVPWCPAPPRHTATQEEQHQCGYQISSSGVSSLRVTNHSLPVRTGLGASGASTSAVTTCTALGHPAAGEFSLSCALLTSACPRGTAGSPALSSQTPWDLEPCGLELCSQGCLSLKQWGSATSSQCRPT